MGDEAIGFVGPDACLLRFFASIDLYEAIPLKPGPVERSNQTISQFGPVDRLNYIEHLNSIAHLICLQGADQVQLQASMPNSALRPMGLRFLYPVFTKYALARNQCIIEAQFDLALTHGDQGDVVNVPASQFSGSGNTPIYELQIFGNIIRHVGLAG
jgi:hypothetical protein